MGLRLKVNEGTSLTMCLHDTAHGCAEIPKVAHVQESAWHKATWCRNTQVSVAHDSTRTGISLVVLLYTRCLS